LARVQRRERRVAVSTRPESGHLRGQRGDAEAWVRLGLEGVVCESMTRDPGGCKPGYLPGYLPGYWGDPPRRGVMAAR
jgi:hypothetical protein